MSLPLSQELKNRARSLGADLVGLAPAVPLPESKAYEDWIAHGMQGTMDYMAKNGESRRDITFWYPEAKSVLICGFSYDAPRSAPPAPGQGRFARYSILPDYHDELKKRLQDLLDWLSWREPGAAGRIFVDTSPLLERLYGRYAGIGWVGKNTMLISPKLGSYFFLCGAALNVALDYDDPVPDHCGTCNRCLKSCPTEAFPRERVLDASRCIAYFTIEHRGAIPEGFRPGIGDWVMGCDLCQEACPWNRFAVPGSVFKPVLDAAAPLEELAALDDIAFKKRFGKTPVTRAKRRGIARNALLAMGNSGDPAYRPALEKAAQDPDPVIAEQASWSLTRLPAPAKS